MEDAVFEVVGPASPRRENNDNRSSGTRTDHYGAGRLLGTLLVYLVGQTERQLRSLSPQAFATLTLSAFFVVFWLFGGFAAWATNPPSRPAMSFIVTEVFTERQDENGMHLLAVGGLLTNLSGTSMAPPALSVVGDGGKLIGTISSPPDKLDDGRSLRFFGRFNLHGGKSGVITVFPSSQ